MLVISTVRLVLPSAQMLASAQLISALDGHEHCLCSPVMFIPLLQSLPSVTLISTLLASAMGLLTHMPDPVAVSENVTP